MNDLRVNTAPCLRLLIPALSGSGGLISVASGLIFPLFVTYFVGLKSIVTLRSPLLSFSISGLLGIVFGLDPALTRDHPPLDSPRRHRRLTPRRSWFSPGLFVAPPGRASEDARR